MMFPEPELTKVASVTIQAQASAEKVLWMAFELQAPGRGALLV